MPEKYLFLVASKIHFWTRNEEENLKKIKHKHTLRQKQANPINKAD